MRKTNSKKSQRKPLAFYKAEVHPGDDGYWWADVPTLPGVTVRAKTLEQLRDKLKEHIAIYLSIQMKKKISPNHIKVDLEG